MVREPHHDSQRVSHASQPPYVLPLSKQWSLKKDPALFVAQASSNLEAEPDKSSLLKLQFHTVKQGTMLHNRTTMQKATHRFSLRSQNIYPGVATNMMAP